MKKKSQSKKSKDAPGLGGGIGMGFQAMQYSTSDELKLTAEKSEKIEKIQQELADATIFPPLPNRYGKVKKSSSERYLGDAEVDKLYARQHDPATIDSHERWQLTSEGPIKMSEDTVKGLRDAGFDFDGDPDGEEEMMASGVVHLPDDATEQSVDASLFIPSPKKGGARSSGNIPSVGEVFSGSPKRNTKSRGPSRWNDYPVEKTYTPSDPFEVLEEFAHAVTPSDSEDFDNVRESIQVLRSNERTLVLAAVVDKGDEDKNIMSAIRCYGGTAFGGYAHDMAKDAYLVQCVEVAQIGHVSFSLVLTMPNVGIWQVKVPIPENVLEKHFSPGQKKLLDIVREKYPAPQYEIHFVQMLGCN